ncbi:MAG: YbaB/EbfC family nucleoid-associated protein [Dehalococcoidia bacterium]
MNKNMIRQAQRQAQKLQDDMQKVQEELEAITVEGTAGGGVVKVVMSGKQVVESVTIEPEAAEELDLLQDLIAAAVNDAFTKTQEIASQKMSAVTGGLNIPGLT